MQLILSLAELGFPDTSCFGHMQLAINAALSSRNTGVLLPAGMFDSLSFYQINRRAFAVGKPIALHKMYVGILHITLKSLLPNRGGILVLHNKDFTKPDLARKLEIDLCH